VNPPLPFTVPQIDEDSTEWWQAVARRELLLQQCSSCQAFRWPARAICGRCASFDWQWHQASGRGRVASWVVNHHTFSPTAPPLYTVVLGRLDEQADIMIPAVWQGSPDGTDLHVGDEISVAYEDFTAPDDAPVTLLRWQPR
jgi:uncharacterized OB-fold protein